MSVRRCIRQQEAAGREAPVESSAVDATDYRDTTPPSHPVTQLSLSCYSKTPKAVKPYGAKTGRLLF